MRSILQAALLATIFSAPSTLLSQTDQTPAPSMPNMQMNSTKMDTMEMMKPPSTLIDTILNHTTSGTSAEPASTPVPMIMRNYHGWMLMLHGTASITDTQQHATSNPTGPSPDTCALFNLP